MKRWSRLSMVVASVAIACAPACQRGTSSPESAQAAGAEGGDKEWTMPNKNASATRFSDISQINTGNVKNLKVAWSFSTGVLRGHEGGPLVIGNIMYVHTPFPNTLYALDLNEDGKILWKYEPKQ